MCEVKREYYKNGKIFKETPYENGKINGVVVYYHENGNLKIKAPYRDGKIHGIIEWFSRLHKDKKIHQEGYRDDIYKRISIKENK